jgi:hypothetical protein
VGIAMLSVELSTIATELPVGLKTAVYFRVGETAISPGCTLLPTKVTTEVESTSCEASTMFSTGAFVPVPLGKSGFETNTRNLRPLGLFVVVEELLLPQEIMVTLAATSTKMLTKILFKPGTPKSMRDRDLDARKRIITERLRGILAAGLACLPPRCKSDGPLVF